LQVKQVGWSVEAGWTEAPGGWAADGVCGAFVFGAGAATTIAALGEA